LPLAAALAALLEGVGELVHVGRTGATEEAQFLVQEEGLHDGISRETENAEEHSADHTGDDAHGDGRRNRIVNRHHLWVVGHDEIATATVEGHDAANAENVEDGTNGETGTESVGVLDHKGE